MRNDPPAPALELTGFQLEEISALPDLDNPSSGERRSNAEIILSGVRRPTVSFDFFHNEIDKTKIAVRLKIERGEFNEQAKLPYWVSVQIAGFFDVMPSETDDNGRISELIAVNSLTILYGVLRGVLATILGWFQLGAKPLPSLYFQELVRERYPPDEQPGSAESDTTEEGVGDSLAVR